MHPDGYFALVLSDDSRKLLRERYASLAKPLCHHCTVKHGTKNPAELPRVFTPADLGRDFELALIGMKTRDDGGVQAAAVALVLPGGGRLDRGFSVNPVPHVTLATDGIAEPFEANALLETGFERIDGPVLQATLVHTYETGDEEP